MRSSQPDLIDPRRGHVGAADLCESPQPADPAAVQFRAAGQMPDTRPVVPADPMQAWEHNAVDITRLNKHDARDRRAINNAWRTLKAESGDNGALFAALFAALRERFPHAGIEVPAETLEDWP